MPGLDERSLALAEAVDALEDAGAESPTLGAILRGLSRWSLVRLALALTAITVAAGWTVETRAHWGRLEERALISADGVGTTPSLLRGLQDLDAAERGYVITGRDEFLEPLRAALAVLPALLADVERAANAAARGTDTAAVGRLVARTRDLVERRMRIANDQVASRDPTDPLAATRAVSPEVGRLTTDSLRVALASMRRVLDRDHAAAVAANAEARDDADRSLAALVILIVLLAVGIGAQLVRLRRKRLVQQRAVERAHRLFATVLNDLGGGVVVVDPLGQVRLRNPAAVRLTNERASLAETFLFTGDGLCAEDGVTPLGPDEAPLARSLRGESLEARCVRPGRGASPPIRLWYISRPITSEAGAIVGAAINFGDVAEQQSLEERLTRATREAEEANRAKSAFLAMMSHEIRTPLYGIVGSADLLRHTRLDERQRNLIDRTRSSAFTLMEIISDILDFSKIEAGQLVLEALPLDLRATIESSACSLYSQARVRGIELLVDVDPRIDFEVVGDQLRLRQVLHNLLGNALKFTTGRPMACVQLAATLEDGPAGSALLRLEIRDTGIGIAPDQLDRLFRPFAQSEAPTTRRFGGSGLGLSITKHVLDAMGGSIEVASAAGVGSTFTVRVPLPRVEANGPPPVPPLAGVRILGVYDRRGIADVAERYLAHAGATVVRADAATPSKGRTDLARTVEVAKGFDALLVGEDQVRPLREQARRDGLQLPALVIVADDLGMHEGNREPASGMTVFLPLRYADLVTRAAQAVGAAEPSGRAGHSRRSVEMPFAERAPSDLVVLVAEDNHVNREVIREQLDTLGFRSLIAADGREALDLMLTHEVGVVLTDCHMPHLDGYGLAAAIRETEREMGRHVPIIAVTADVSPGEVARCKLAGMDDYLSKPMTLSELDACLRRWTVTVGSGAEAPAAPPAAPVTGEGAAFDATALAQFVSKDVAVQRQILTAFLDSARTGSLEISTAVDAGEIERAIELAHRLRSTAVAVGARRLAATLRELETAPRSDSTASFRARAVAIRSAFHDLEPVARGWLD